MTGRSAVRRRLGLTLASVTVLAACSSGTSTSQSGADAGAAEQPPSAVPVGEITRAEQPSGDDAAGAADTDDATAAETSTTVAPPTTEPPPRYYDEACVVEIEPGDTLVGIVERFDDGETINRVSLRAENGLADERLTPGSTLDVCPGNGIDDVTGAERVDASDEVVAAAMKTNIEVQQLKLNQLFEPLGARELLVDGISGPVTRQRLCAARLSLGLDPSITDMAPGSEEERLLLALDELPPPPNATVDQDQWALIDVTCQFMFVGSTDELVFGFPTSTGEDGHRTRIGERRRAFRYDPATDNGGWHDSSDFPVSIDNPLNGNMYRPIYFDGGQAIHGANNVPTSPQSKGCARLSVENMDMLVNWLGLGFDTAPTWSQRAINLTVSIQGEFIPFANAG